MKNKSRITLMIALGVGLVLVSIAAGWSWQSQVDELAQHRQQLSDLTAQVAQRATSIDEARANAAASQAGVSAEQIKRDSDQLIQITTTAWQWESGEEYEAARSELITQLGVPESSQFMTVLMPPADYNQDMSGTRYYAIDGNGIDSSTTGGFDIAVTQVKPWAVTYVMTFDQELTPHNPDLTGEAHRRTMVIATIDADGTITDIAGYGSSTDARHAG